MKSSFKLQSSQNPFMTPHIRHWNNHILAPNQTESNNGQNRHTYSENMVNGIYKKSGIENHVCRLCWNRDEDSEENRVAGDNNDPDKLNPLLASTLALPLPLALLLALLVPVQGFSWHDLREMQKEDWTPGQWTTCSSTCERVTRLEEGVGRLERRYSADEVVTEVSICVSNLPRDPHKADGMVAGKLVAALDVDLSPDRREDTTHRPEA